MLISSVACVFSLYSLNTSSSVLVEGFFASSLNASSIVALVLATSDSVSAGTLGNISCRNASLPLEEVVLVHDGTG